MSFFLTWNGRNLFDMKRIVVMLFLLASFCSFGQKKYYVANKGNDLNDGLTAATAWNSLEKVSKEQGKFKPGDEILFKGGDKFETELILNNIKGTANNPITFKSFGQGKAIITSNSLVSKWENEGGGVYSSQIDGEVYQVFRDQKRLKNARSSRMKISSVVNSTSFISDDLKGMADLTGASILYKGVVWSLSMSKIIGYNSSTGMVILNKAPSHKLNTTHNEFWVINDKSELKNLDEWIYDGKLNKVFMKSNTTPKGVEFTVGMKNGFVINGCSYLYIDNIDFRGINDKGIIMRNSSFCKILNNSFNYCYQTGITAFGNDNFSSLEVRNNKVKGTMRNGIHITYSNSIITNNEVTEIGTEDIYTYQDAAAGFGIRNDGDDCKISSNFLSNLGYNGIAFVGERNLVSKNNVQNFCNFLTDGGGIYTYAGFWNTPYSKGSEVSNNIIIGTGNYGHSADAGIYLDGKTQDILVKNNSITKSYPGILVNHNRNIRVISNNLYKNKKGITIAEYSSQGPAGEVYGNILTNNNIYVHSNEYQNNCLVIYSNYNSLDLYKGEDNIYFNHGKENPIGIWKDKTEIDYNLEKYKSLTNTEINSSQNINTVETFKISSILTENSIYNGDFSNGIDGWYGSSSAIESKEDGLRIFNIKQGGYVGQKGSYATFVKGKKYLLEFDVKGSGGDLGFRLQQLSDGFKNTGIQYLMHPSNEWKKYRFIITPKFEGSKVRLTFHSKEIAAQFNLDNISLKEVTLANEPDNSFFAINNSEINKVISLPSGSWQGIRDKKLYTGTITLKPYTSIIFIKSDNDIGDIKVNAGEDQTICKGEEITLIASGGSSYLWDTGSTSNSITVSPSSTRTYTVTVEEGGESASDNVTVNVDDVTANAGIDQIIMQGENILLTATGGDYYRWSNGESTKSITVSPSETTKYTVTAIKGACEDTDDVIVSVTPSTTDITNLTVNAGEDQTICLGDRIELKGSGGGTYAWSNGETSESITISPIRTSTFTLSVTLGSQTYSDTVTITVEKCSNDNLSNEFDQNIKIYPNPAESVLYIESNSVEEDLKLIINDIKGSIMKSDVIKSSSAKILNKKIDVSSYEPGTYVLRIIGLRQQVIKKIIVI